MKLRILSCEDVRRALPMRQAVIVCTATTSTTPVFADADVRPGTHINGIGAYTPQMQEIPAETVLRAKVVIDHREANLAEAGDLLNRPPTRGWRRG